MLLIFLLVIITIVLFSISFKWNMETGLKEGIGFITLCISVVTCLVLISLIVISILQNIDSTAKIASKKQLYSSLVYQLENDIYNTDVGKKELYNQITEWNQDIAYGKGIQHSIWIGCCWPNIYDNFEVIELEDYG